MSPKNTATNTAIWMTFALVSLAVIPISVPKCVGDFGCEYNQFCYTPSGICIECLDCSQYNRVTSEFQSCHHSPEDCGACVKGFIEEYLSQQVKRDACVVGYATSTTTATTTTITVVTKASQKNTSSKFPATPVSEYPKELIFATVGISVACVVVFILIGIYIYNFGRTKPVNNQAIDQDVESPRQCKRSTSSPLLPVQIENFNDESSSTLQEPLALYKVCPTEMSEERVIILHLPDQKQKETSLCDAFPWADTVSSRSSSPESIEGNGEGVIGPGSPAIVDEETYPSAWEPGPNHRPRHLRESDSVSLQVDAPEEDCDHSVPNENLEHVQNSKQASPSPSPGATNAVQSEDFEHVQTSRKASCSPHPEITPSSSPEATPSSGLQLSIDRPFRHLVRDSEGEQPDRKRRRQQDSLSLGAESQSSVAPLHGEDSSSSLAQDLSVISRFPFPDSSRDVRHT